MIKLSTKVEVGKSSHQIRLEDKIMLLGSCFVDNMAAKFKDAGFDVLCNPFGTLYNPASILSAIRLLDSDRMFEESDIVQMGAGSELFCSFSHHTSFARPSVEEFLENANSALQEARENWHKCTKVIVTLGTSWVWQHDGKVVSNCLKRPAKEFEHRLLALDEIESCISEIQRSKKQHSEMQHSEKQFIFTVSPIRHLGQGAHANTVSKGLLHLALVNQGVEYFPAYEILIDELRDYRFYAEDLVHPSKVAVDIIWERFLNYAVPQEQMALIEQNEKLSRSHKHVNKREVI